MMFEVCCSDLLSIRKSGAIAYTIAKMDK